MAVSPTDASISTGPLLAIGGALTLGVAAAAARLFTKAGGVLGTGGGFGVAARDGDGEDDEGDDNNDLRPRDGRSRRSKSSHSFALLRRRAGSTSGLAMIGLGKLAPSGPGGGGSGGNGSGGGGGNPSANPPPLHRSASAAEAGARWAPVDDGPSDGEDALRGYVPWEDLGRADQDGDPYFSGRAVAIDCTHPSLPTLTHHRANRNPPGLSPLADTSTGIVLSALGQLSSWRCPRHVREVMARPYASCNHFDVDGLLAIWCFLPQNRARALQSEPALRHAARIGDLREAFLCPDLVSALGAEDRVTFIREAYTALKIATWVSATEKRLFSAPYAARDAAQKYRWFLPRLSRVLADPEVVWSDWQRDYSAVVSGFEMLSGPDALVERWWPRGVPLDAPPAAASFFGGGGQQPAQQRLGGLIGTGVSLVMGGIGNLLQLGAGGGGDDDDDDTDEDEGEGGGGNGGGNGGNGNGGSNVVVGGGGYDASEPSGVANDPEDGGLGGVLGGVLGGIGGGGGNGSLRPCPLVVVRAPEPQRYVSLFSHTAGCDAVLSLYDGRRYELEVKYTTFVQLASRAAWPRLDLRPLAAALNDLEARAGGPAGLAACNGLEPLLVAADPLAGGGGEGLVQVAPVRWVADAVTDPGPLMRLERVVVVGPWAGEGGEGADGDGDDDGGGNSCVRVLKLPKVQRYGDPCDRPIYASTLAPAKLQAVVASYFETALRETGARPRGPVTAVLATGGGPGDPGAGDAGYGGGASADNTGGAGWSWEALGALNDDLRRRVAPEWRRSLLERDARGEFEGLVAGHGHQHQEHGAGARVAGASAGPELGGTTGWHYDTERSGRRRNSAAAAAGGAAAAAAAAAAAGAGAGAAVYGGGDRHATPPPLSAPTTPTAAQILAAQEEQHAIPLVPPPAAYGDPAPHLSELSPLLLAAAQAQAQAAAANAANAANVAGGAGGSGGNVAAVDETAPLRALAAALPALQRRKPWNLLYSTARDGTSLSTLFRKAAGHGRAPTVLLVRDGAGGVFGAYCTEPWRPQRGFFGTGESWVFRLAPGAPTRYPWVGPGHGSSALPAAALSPASGGDGAGGGGDDDGDKNSHHRRAVAPARTDFFQYATPDGLGVGGGGHFAIFLDEELLRGGSAHCLTYASPCLAAGGEEFEVRDVELWWVGGADGARVGAVQAAMAGVGVGGGIAPVRWTAH